MTGADRTSSKPSPGTEGRGGEQAGGGASSLPRGRDALLKLLLAAASVVAFLLLIEGYFRLMRIDPPVTQGTSYLNLIPSMVVERHPYHPDNPLGIIAGYFYRYRPKSIWGTQYPSNERGRFDAANRVIYYMNAQGFRDRDFTLGREPGTFRVAALGDSFTLGEGVQFEETFAKVAEARLRETCPGCEVMNFGVNGYGFDDEMVLLKNFVLPYRPDLVVFGFFINDISHYLTDKLNIDLEKEKADWPLATRSRAVNYFAKRLWDRHVARTYVEAYLGFYESEQLWGQLRGLFLEARGLLEANGARMLVAVFPELKAMTRGSYVFAPIHEKLAGFFREAGIEHIDLYGPWKSYGAGELLVHSADPHPNEIGHRIIAEEIVAAIRRMGLPPGRPPG